MEKKNTKRNPKTTKGGSSLPRVQSHSHSQPQPVYRPQMYQSHSQSQPQPVYRTQMYESFSHSQPVYRHQMYEPESPSIAYNQQPPLSQLPQNFNPFESRIYQPKRRERYMNTLPIQDDDQGDDFFDNVDMIPETQPNNEEVEEVEANEVEAEEVVPEVVKRPKKAEKKHWTPDEEEALAMSWIKISTDKEVGDRQTREGFWKRVLKHFQSLMPGTTRTKDQLNSKWGIMNGATVAFNGYYHQAVRINQSGCNDLQIFERALLDFEKHYKKPFTHHKAWHIVKNQPKWLELPTVGQDSEGTSKKRKSTDSSNVPTPPSVNEFDCELPNLNDNPTTPSRHSRGKKKKNIKTSSSTRDTLKTYTTKKETLMMSQMEAQKKKDEEYFKFIDGEVYNRDMKFVMEPHDNIPDPAFKEFVIGKKRELCAKYNWPCSL